jgi:hypothetical protein
MARKRSCENKDVVNVANRLHSPFYDTSWYQLHDGMAMCYWYRCGPEDVNAWFKATEKYYDETLIPLLARTRKRADAVYGGAALPQKISDVFSKVAGDIAAWSAFSDEFKPPSLLNEFAHPHPDYWMGEAKEIVRFFDEAACRVDDLNDILELELDSAALAERPPLHQANPPPDGNSWFEGDDARAGGGGSSVGVGGTAVGLILVGAGLYFGYKVLTE